MKILKSYRSSGHEDLTTFVNDNNIPHEDIVTITRGDSFSDAVSLVIFFMLIQTSR